MPRGSCEKCRQHDMFVHATATAGRNAFLCARCLHRFAECDGSNDYKGKLRLRSPVTDPRIGCLPYAEISGYRSTHRLLTYQTRGLLAVE